MYTNVRMALFWSARFMRSAFGLNFHIVTAKEFNSKYNNCIILFGVGSYLEFENGFTSFQNGRYRYCIFYLQLAAILKHVESQ